MLECALPPLEALTKLAGYGYDGSDVEIALVILHGATVTTATPLPGTKMINVKGLPAPPPSARVVL